MLPFSKQVGLQVLVFHPNEEPTVDIVAIHGLGANSHQAWTCSNVDWLSDPRMLPEALPKARIMRYDYRLEGGSIRLCTSAVAEELLLCLQLERKACTGRPIIFIGHCFGGLIIQKALHMASLRKYEQLDLLSSTIGIVFMGTPQLGTTKVSRALLFATIASCHSLSIDKTTLTSFLLEDGFQAQVFDQFVELCNTSGIHLLIYCFVEENATKVERMVGNKYIKGFVVDDHYGSIQDYPTCYLSLDHFHMNKFSCPADKNYQLVREKLQILAGCTNRKRNSYCIVGDRTKCLQFLRISTPDYRFDKGRDIYRASGTCMWLLDNDTFNCWLQKSNASVLFLSGIPGSGKSVLTAFLIDRIPQLHKQVVKDNIVCYFFFKRDNKLHNNAVSALSSVLYQLIRSRPHLVTHAIKEMRNKGGGFTKDFQTLWDILMATAMDQSCGNTICILDGLDECEQTSQFQILQALAKFYTVHSSQGDGPNLKFLTTACPENLMHAQLRGIPTVHFTEEHESRAISTDVEFFISEKLQQLVVYQEVSRELQTFLKDEIIKMANGIFLYAYLALDLIEYSAKITHFGFYNGETHLPTSLDSIYWKTFQELPKSATAKKVLQVVAAATRPLTLDELGILLAVKDENTPLGNSHMSPNFSDQIRDLCGPFIKVKNSRVIFVHHTALQFLTRTIDESAFNVPFKKRICPPIESNFLMARVCISYLQFADFKQCGLGVSLDRFNDDTFLEYAAKSWPWHFREAKEMARPLIDAALNLCDTSSKRFKMWFGIYLNKLTPHSHRLLGPTPLMTVSFLGYDIVIQRILTGDNIDVDITDGNKRTALHFAAMNGHHSVVKLLINASANANVKDYYGWTPLYLAAESGHTEVARLLLDKTIDITAQSNHGWTAFFAAAENGHDDIVKLLLRKHSINTNDHDKSMALNLAVRNGHKKVVKTLLDANIITHRTTLYGRTALHIGAEKGHDDAIRLLLNAGLNPNAQADFLITPLHLAAKSGHRTSAELLLDAGSKANVSDSQGRTPLHLAVKKGHIRVVKLFLTNAAYVKIDVNARDINGWTALHYAAKRGDGEETRLLLSANAKATLKTITGETALHFAAKNGYTRIVQQLIKRDDTELDSKDDLFERTPLAYAAEKGHVEIVKLLITTNIVNMNSRDINGLTPLLLAAQNQHEAVVRLIRNTSEGNGRHGIKKFLLLGWNI